jgi:hypothetical protein
MTCECHKINWMARVQNPDKNYRMVDGSPYVEGVGCQDKVNLGTMDYHTYLTVCKYMPEEGSLFPEEVLQDLISDMSENPATIRPAPVPESTLPNTPPICQQVLGWYGHTEEEAEAAASAVIDSYINSRQ